MYQVVSHFLYSLHERNPRGFLLIYECVCERERERERERGQKRGWKVQKRKTLPPSCLKHRIFTFSRESASEAAMLFRLIKENEIWAKSHGAYLQKYMTCADEIAHARSQP
jgi:hypothetical protein